MAQKISCGILMYRLKEGNKIEVLLVHPGGPFYKNKDNLFWSIPKGLSETDSLEEKDLLEEAIREFKEETSNDLEDDRSKYLYLDSIKQKSGKIVHAWAIPGDLTEPFKSNTFSMEWPSKSGKVQDFPEADKGEFFEPALAKDKLNPEQARFIDRLLEKLN